MLYLSLAKNSTTHNVNKMKAKLKECLAKVIKEEIEAKDLECKKYVQCLMTPNCMHTN